MTSASFVNGTNVDGSEGSYLTWQITSQNEAGNYSTIAWQAGWRFSTTSCRGLRLGKAIINGTTVYDDHDSGDGVHTYNSSHDHTPKLQTASGTINVAHNSDGTKAVTMSITMTGFSGLLSSGSDSWSLTVIPQFSDPPSTPTLAVLSSTSIFVTFTDGAGGAAIDSRQIGYGTSAILPPTTTVSSDGSDTITGLTPGTQYYFWARTHNSAGYSDWSPRANATTMNVPDAPSIPVISSITQTTVVATWHANGSNGSTIIDMQLGYGTSSSAPTTTVTATSPKTVTGLLPGVKYYFWARVRNGVGYGPWSASSNATTIAGARVKVGGVWKNAIPYVRVSGVWKLARPWVRVMGTWKESQ